MSGLADRVLALEEDLFGDPKISPSDASEKKSEGAAPPLFVVDRTGEPDEDDRESVAGSSVGSAAWTDDQDDLEVSLRDKSKLSKLRENADEDVVGANALERRLRKRARGDDGGRPVWSRSGSSRVATTRENVHSAVYKSKADVERLKDLSQTSRAVVQSICWSPSSELVFTGGFDKRVRVFQVDQMEKHEMIQSLFLEDFPISQMAVVGQELLVAGKRRHFFSVDLETGTAKRVPGINGRDTNMHTFASPSSKGAPCVSFLSGNELIHLSTKTKNRVGSSKVNAAVTSASYWDVDPTKLFATDAEGFVYVFDVRKGSRALSKVRDDGSTRSTSVLVRGGVCAVGSDKGIVNLYSTNEVLNAKCEPHTTIDSLTTTIDRLAISGDKKYLVASSKRLKDQLRLVHLKTKHVARNWPTKGTPLSYASDVAFSPSEERRVLAIANDKGRVLMYRVK